MESVPPFCVSLLLFFFFSGTTTKAQQALALAPAGPPNITAILKKAGQFTTLIRLLKSTQVADQINNQLNNSNTGLTLFAPTNNAFTSLSPGTLNSLTDQQKVALIQFHVLPSMISQSQFQTVSNPLRTQAGDAYNGQFPLNVTTVGNQVNITTGVINTTISNTIFSSNNLAVYQVDKVLLPMELFGSPAPAEAPALAPAPSKPKKASAAAPDSPDAPDAPTSSRKDTADNSIAISLVPKTATVFIFTATVYLPWLIL